MLRRPPGSLRLPSGFWPSPQARRSRLPRTRSRYLHRQSLPLRRRLLRSPHGSSPSARPRACARRSPRTCSSQTSTSARYFLVHSWLLTLRVRASPLVLAMRGTYDDDAYDEAAVGLGLGRQLRLGRSVLALTGESNVTYIWIESDALNLSMERAQLRLAAVARWGYPVGRGVRLHAAVEGEISPTGLVNGASEAGLAAFPAFTLGLCLGAEVVL